MLGLHEFDGSRLVLDDFVSLFKDFRLARIELAVDSLDDDVVRSRSHRSFESLDGCYTASAHDIRNEVYLVTAEVLDGY